jgi:hypothetical protein
MPSGEEIRAPGSSALWVLRGSCNAHGPRSRRVRADILPVLAGPCSSVRHGDVCMPAAGTLSTANRRACKRCNAERRRWGLSSRCRLRSGVRIPCGSAVRGSRFRQVVALPPCCLAHCCERDAERRWGWDEIYTPISCALSVLLGFSALWWAWTTLLYSQPIRAICVVGHSPVV